MEKQIPKSLGIKLKQTRTKAKLTQEEVADKAEVRSITMLGLSVVR